MKLTQWHKGNVKPIHIGVYEKGSDDKYTYYSFWTGKIWNVLTRSPIDAKEEHIAHPTYESIYCDDKWRGLAKKPKGMK
jgi:hypothetical protein